MKVLDSLGVQAPRVWGFGVSDGLRILRFGGRGFRASGLRGV